MIADERSRRRRLSDQEYELWRGVLRSVVPLKRRRAQPDKPPQSEKAGHPSKNSVIANSAIAQSTVAKAVPRKPGTESAPRMNAAVVKAANPKSPPGLLQLDRRARQRIARGIDAIDARIDLHGRTQHDAHGVLLQFLRRAQADGARTVLVITGKGSGDRLHERGVLRRQVPLWFALPEFRTFVVGIEDAHVGHGGEGALYVRLRRAR